MRPRQTIWLVGLAVALLAFVLVYERRTLDTDARAARAARALPGFHPAGVVAIEILRSNQTLRAERVGERWRLTAPVAYPALAARIEALLLQLAGLSAEQRAPGRKPAEFGLAPPQATILLHFPTNHIEVRIGGKSPVGERLYFQVAGDPDVLATDAVFAERLPASPNDWRDPALLDLDGLSFNRVEVRGGGRGFAVQRDVTNNEWQLIRPMSARADHPKVERLIESLKTWRVEEFVTDDPARELEPLGLQPPEFELVFGRGTNDLAVVQFGKITTNDPPLVYARRLSHTNIVRVAPGPLEALRAPFNNYRDRRLLTFRPEEVEVIEIQAEDNFTVRRLTNDVWRVTEPLNFAADAGLVTNLLAELAGPGLEIVEFVKDVVTDFGAYGLAPPRRTYTLRGGGTNPVIARIEFGTNQLDKVFAHRADENSVYAVSYGHSLLLPGALFQLRDRRVWNFSASNVVSVAIHQQGRARKLVRDAKREWVNAAGSTGEVNPFSVEETLHRLGELRAVSWIARGTDKRAAFAFPQADYRITLELAGADKPQSLTLEFGGMSRLGRPYVATTIDGEWIVFEFPAGLLESVLRDLRVSAPAPAPKAP
jgi:hypothetical protein